MPITIVFQEAAARMAILPRVSLGEAIRYQFAGFKLTERELVLCKSDGSGDQELIEVSSAVKCSACEVWRGAGQSPVG